MNNYPLALVSRNKLIPVGGFSTMIVSSSHVAPRFAIKSTQKLQAFKLKKNIEVLDKVMGLPSRINK